MKVKPFGWCVAAKKRFREFRAKDDPDREERDREVAEKRLREHTGG